MVVMGGQVAFRVDAGHVMGIGHVMRCLTLAAELREQGATCRFICRNHPGHLAAVIKAQGFNVTLLPIFPHTTEETTPSTFHEQSAPFYASWLGAPWHDDAAETLTAFGSERVDWLVIDHYAVDHRWHAMMRPVCNQIAVIDDLADRAYDCDVLLDQTYGRKAQDYAPWVPKLCRGLFGSQYALLRPEFSNFRCESQARRAALAEQKTPLRSLLVTIGGSDPENITGALLKALGREAAMSDVHVTAVLGPTAPHRENVIALVATLPFTCKILVGPTNMADLMVQADLAIGAAGTTTWERCCLGLPSLMLITAENQTEIAHQLQATGAAKLLNIDDFDSVYQELIGMMATYSTYSQASQELCDGHGAQRVAQAMAAITHRLRPAQWADCEAIWQWRRAGEALKFYRQSVDTSLVDHSSWYRTALQDQSKNLWIFEIANQAVCYIRLDHGDARQTATISIYVAPGARGQGFGALGLQTACRQAQREGFVALFAEVHEDNLASQRLFLGQGFSETTAQGLFKQYKKLIT